MKSATRYEFSLKRMVIFLFVAVLFSLFIVFVVGAPWWMGAIAMVVQFFAGRPAYDGGPCIWEKAVAETEVRS